MENRIENEITISSPTGLSRKELADAFRDIEIHEVTVDEIKMHRHTLINCIRDWMYKEIEPCRKDENTEENVFAYLWSAKLTADNTLPTDTIVLVSEPTTDSDDEQK